MAPNRDDSHHDRVTSLSLVSMQFHFTPEPAKKPHLGAHVRRVWRLAARRRIVTVRLGRIIIIIIIGHREAGPAPSDRTGRLRSDLLDPSQPRAE